MVTQLDNRVRMLRAALKVRPECVRKGIGDVYRELVYKAADANGDGPNRRLQDSITEVARRSYDLLDKVVARDPRLVIPEAEKVRLCQLHAEIERDAALMIESLR